MNVLYQTDVGRVRSQNQDSVFVSDSLVGKLPNLMIVADGMGGHKAGDYASRRAIETLTEVIRTSEYENPVLTVADAVRKANSVLYRESMEHEEYRGMGTTMTLSYVEDGKVIAHQIGDSRLYLYSDGLRQITRDHSYVEEMVRKGLLERGSLEYLQKKNIITRALGGNDYIAADYYEEAVNPGDMLLSCSDGLTNMVSDGQIEEVLKSEMPPEKKVEELIRLANDNGGQDNITVILAMI